VFRFLLKPESGAKVTSGRARSRKIQRIRPLTP
jgi:hypothetical protein